LIAVPLVDLRHEATHGPLPTLHALRLATHSALAWLRTSLGSISEMKYSPFLLVTGACCRYWEAQQSVLETQRWQLRRMLQDIHGHSPTDDMAALAAMADLCSPNSVRYIHVAAEGRGLTQGFCFCFVFVFYV
jgi:hypothetical protein